MGEGAESELVMVRPFVIVTAFALFEACHSDPTEGMHFSDRVPIGQPYQAPPPNPQVMVAVDPQEAPKSTDAPKPEVPKAEAPKPDGAKQEAPKTDEKADAAAAEKVRDETDEARARNEIAYENEYLRMKERLVPDQLGKWLAIVNGKIVPSDSHGKPEGAATMENCIDFADTVDPKALHRFVFRIGEEGDVLYADPAHSARSVVGSALKSVLAVSSTYDVRTSEVTWTRAGRTHRFKLERERFPILLSDPVGRQSMETLVADSSGFGGFFALEAVSAIVLDGPRFEIPGRVLLKTGDGFQELRRTRVRVHISDLDVDVVVPAAAWPR
jgi:hypothetical protein